MGITENSVSPCFKKNMVEYPKRDKQHKKRKDIQVKFYINNIE